MQTELLQTSNRPSGDIYIVLIGPDTPDAGSVSCLPDGYSNHLPTHSYWVVFDLPIALKSQEEILGAAT
jgi:hypothetical protein